MTKEEWIRLNEILVKNYTQFLQDYLKSNIEKTSKRRRLATRNVGFALGRAQWYISDREGSKLLLDDYLANKPYGVEEFFQPNYFLTDMKEFLELVEATITSSLINTK